MQIASAEAFLVAREDLAGIRDRWPQTFLKLHGPTDRFLQNCRSNHLHWAYGDHAGELVAYCKMLDIEPVIT